MFKHSVRTPEDALNYITECNLATVLDLAGKRSRPAGEFKRQVDIAQQAITWMQEMGVEVQSGRAKKVIANFQGSVMAYAESYFPAPKLN